MPGLKVLATTSYPTFLLRLRQADRRTDRWTDRSILKDLCWVCEMPRGYQIGVTCGCDQGDKVESLTNPIIKELFDSLFRKPYDCHNCTGIYSLESSMTVIIVLEYSLSGFLITTTLHSSPGFQRSIH